jgi:hypothetical protein
MEGPLCRLRSPGRPQLTANPTRVGCLMPHRPWRIRIDESVPAEILTELGLSSALPRNQWLSVEAPEPEAKGMAGQSDCERMKMLIGTDYTSSLSG